MSLVKKKKMTEHPITPPPELVRQWENEARDGLRHHYGETYECFYNDIATQAARWGADQELEACCEVLRQKGVPAWSLLRATRRPKPPSLKQQALEELDCIPTHDSEGRTLGADVSIVRRALEALPDD